MADGSIQCACGQLAVVKQSNKDNENKGRSFFACPNPQESSCRFFCWTEDDPHEALQRQMARSARGSSGGYASNFQRGGTVGGFSQRGVSGMGRGQATRGAGNWGGGGGGASTKPGGNFTPQSPWEKPYSVIQPQSNNNYSGQSNMDVEPAMSGDANAKGNATDKSVLDRLDKCERSLTSLIETVNAKICQIYDEVLAVKNGSIQVQNESANHLRAITDWIQSHVEEQDAKKKPQAKK